MNNLNSNHSHLPISVAVCRATMYKLRLIGERNRQLGKMVRVHPAATPVRPHRLSDEIHDIAAL